MRVGLGLEGKRVELRVGIQRENRDECEQNVIYIYIYMYEAAN